MQSGDGTAAWNTKYSAWEFVHCGICYLPFINPRNPEAPPPVPFWLTECSHVVCNNHLNPDQTCRQCADGAHIELMPLQLDLPEPMRKWFQPLPNDLTDLVGASKFQHESMANLVRFYKGKCLGQKELIERLRRELDTLKAEASQMRQERELADSGNQRSDPVYDFVNGNGKRRRLDDSRQESFAVERGSLQRHSPQSGEPAYGSSRLTLRPGSSRVEREKGQSYLSNASGERLTRRQGGRSSPISLEDFAYQLADRENERGGTARASMGTSNVVGSKGSSTARSITATNDFSAGPSQFNTPSRSMSNASSRNESFQVPVQMLNRQADGVSNPQTANRQRCQPPPPATGYRALINSNLGPSRTVFPSNLTKVAGSGMGYGPRRFVPPTPTRQALKPVSGGGAQQQRTQSQSQMPPPPLPGNPRFR